MKAKKYTGIDMKKTGEWLRFISRFRGIAVKELCIALAMGSPQSIYGWFAGRTLPSLDNYYALSRFLGMQLGELIVGQDEEVPEPFAKKVGLQNTRFIRYRMKLAF